MTEMRFLLNADHISLLQDVNRARREGRVGAQMGKFDLHQVGQQFEGGKVGQIPLDCYGSFENKDVNYFHVEKNRQVMYCNAR